MKGLFKALLFILVPLCAVYLTVTTLPYYAYNKFIKGEWSHELYRLAKWNEKFLAPDEVRGTGELREEFVGLWREFHLRDAVVSLPTGHPMFRTIPIITAKESATDVGLGIQFVGPSGREISKLFLLKSGSWSDQFQEQGLFELPLVRRELMKRSSLEVWNDVFSKKITGWDLPWQTMVYNLYILHLRQRLLPEGFVAYGKLDGSEGMAYVEMPSPNKDYRTEIVMSFDKGLILSYLLVSERDNADSADLRTRFLKGIKFRPSDEALSPLIYREFKNLSFARQVDQEGMLYLLSAWSHSLQDVELLKEMIYFLERSPQNVSHLKPLYRYAFTRYKKTFTTQELGLESDDADIRLQREIELEELRERLRLQERPKTSPVAPVLTPKDQMDSYLRRARENKTKGAPKKRDKLIVH